MRHISPHTTGQKAGFLSNLGIIEWKMAEGICQHQIVSCMIKLANPNITDGMSRDICSVLGSSTLECCLTARIMFSSDK